MTGFETEQRGETTFLTYIVEEGALDTALSGMLLRNRIPGLLAYSAAQVDRDRICSYNITSKISLKQYFSRPVKKDVLLKVFLGILSAVENAEEYMIRQSDLLFDSEYIYISVSDCVPELVCLPVKREGERQENAVLAFFRGMMVETEFDRQEDRSYVAELIGFMNRPEAAQYDTFRKQLERMRGPVRVARPPVPERREPVPERPAEPRPTPAPPVPPVRPLQPDQPSEEKKRFSFFPAKKEKPPKPPKQPKPGKGKKVAVDSANVGFNVPGITPPPPPPTEAAQTPPPSAGFDVGSPAKGAGDHVPRQTPVAVVDLASEETVVMGSGGLLGKTDGKPWLVQLRTGVACPMDRFPFRIGKEASYVDFCVIGNAAVSRSHADIESGEDGFYITDNNSKNHTFLEKEQLLPGKPYLLPPGAHFFLANEEFVFELR